MSRRDSLHGKERRDKRRGTGVVGVSVLRTATNRRDGTMQTYFVASIRNAQGRPLKRRHCISTLGREEAWRRALRDRAAHERALGMRAGVPTTPAREHPDPTTARRASTNKQAQPA
jgi:hypothetical protein